MNAKTDPAVEKILERLRAGETVEWSEVGDRAATLASLAETVPALEGDAARHGLELMVDLGRPLRPAGAAKVIAPCVTDAGVIAFLAHALDHAAFDFRDLACAVLAREVPDSLVRHRSREILAAVARHPDMDGAALLAAKTGAEEAERLLQSQVALRRRNPAEALVAAGRLGDSVAEEAVLEAYRALPPSPEKGDQAKRIGRMATPKAVLFLAREIRTPETYAWRKTSRRSQRLHVIDGLHEAWPAEPVFWKPLSKPVDDAYYLAVEAWLESRLGIHWDRTRPPFLYEEEAPLTPGGGN